ncbi:MAG: alpha/beta hydrolase, partial [Bacteroidia bacterium]|nr:alpha/beta hydrolase [Bacteroidia bacterium]
MRLLASLCLGLLAPSVAATTDALPEPMVFDAWKGPPLRAFVFRPENAADDAPVIFVMHGVKRDADRYFAEWRPLASRYGFVIVVPEFPTSEFPGADSYNLGGVVDESGAVTERDLWAFSAIEPMFDAARSRLGLSSERYVLYGHSAGAQFAHRFALFAAGPRARMVISANAGWYTFPETGAWPYGPHGLPAGVYDPAKAIAAPLVVLAGEADVNPNHPSLRRSPEANAQGKTRFERA